ncbi:MAG TPA: hypothetical protein VN622_11355 [Clostridia bacterium]|nr:hypothetical protein [Clostridia bacterium]
MEINNLILRVSEDLQAIQQLLGNLCKDDPSGADIRDSLDRNVIGEYKSTIDKMRLYLLAYLELASKTEGVSSELHALRVRPVTEMLEVFEEPNRTQDASTVLAQSAETDSFIAQVTRIATIALNKHKSADPEACKSAKAGES